MKPITFRCRVEGGRIVPDLPIPWPEGMEIDMTISTELGKAPLSTRKEIADWLRTVPGADLGRLDDFARG